MDISWSRICANVALFGGAVGDLGNLHCRSYKITWIELLNIAINEKATIAQKSLKWLKPKASLKYLWKELNPRHCQVEKL